MAGETDVVGHHADRGALAVELAQEVHDGLAIFGVEVSGGLVGEEDAGLAAQGPGHGDALLLAARKLARIVPHAVAHPDLFQRLGGALFALGGGESPVGQGKLDVLEDREVADEVEALENETDLAVPDPGALGVVDAGDVVAVELVGALGRRVEQPEDREQRRLAAARRTGDGDVLPLVDVEVDAG